MAKPTTTERLRRLYGEAATVTVYRTVKGKRVRYVFREPIEGVTVAALAGLTRDRVYKDVRLRALSAVEPETNAMVWDRADVEAYLGIKAPAPRRARTKST